MSELFKTIESNGNFTILDKVSGVSCHPSPGDPAPDLVTILGRDGIKLAPVTRLDNQASGLVLMSNDAEFITDLEDMTKVYCAIVVGAVDDSGKIDRPLTMKKFQTREKVEQEALTEYERTELFGDKASLLKISIATGRHHQIRKHLRSIEHPVIGDFRHGYKDRNLEFQNNYGKRLRLFLHCTQLSFVWDGETRNFDSPIPEDMLAFIEFLKKV